MAQAALTPAERERLDARRRTRMQARDVLRALTGSDRVRSCGCKVRSAEGVGVRLSPDGRAGFGGLATCANRWVCPVCAAKILHGRSEEAHAATRAWLAADPGNTVGMLTLTMRHHAGDGLADLWDGLSAAWRGMVSSRWWDKWRAAAGVEHYLRATEVTHGRNGWHIHLHVLVFLSADPRPLTDRKGVPYYATEWDIFRVWGEQLHRRGYSSWARVQDFRRYTRATAEEAAKDIAGYGAKATYPELDAPAHLEATRSDLKRGAGGNRTPFDILASMVERVLMRSSVEVGAEQMRKRRDWALWREYEAASAGRRGLVWSKGAVLALLGGQEATDEDLAGEEVGTVQDTILYITARSWARVCRRPPGARCRILEVTEREGTIGLRRLLDSWGIRWRNPGPVT